jgi:hypothetical protein
MRNLVHALSIASLISMTTPLAFAEPAQNAEPKLTATQSPSAEKVNVGAFIQRPHHAPKFNVMASVDRAKSLDDKHLDQAKGGVWVWVAAIGAGAAIACTWSVGCLQFMVTDPACNLGIIC